MLVGCAAPHAEDPAPRAKASVADLEQHALEKRGEREVEALFRLLDQLCARGLEGERLRDAWGCPGGQRSLPNPHEEIIIRSPRGDRAPPHRPAPSDPGTLS